MLHRLSQLSVPYFLHPVAHHPRPASYPHHKSLWCYKADHCHRFHVVHARCTQYPDPGLSKTFHCLDLDETSCRQVPHLMPDTSRYSSRETQAMNSDRSCRASASRSHQSRAPNYQKLLYLMTSAPDRMGAWYWSGTSVPLPSIRSLETGCLQTH